MYSLENIFKNFYYNYNIQITLYDNYSNLKFFYPSKDNGLKYNNKYLLELLKKNYLDNLNNYIIYNSTDNNYIYASFYIDNKHPNIGAIILGPFTKDINIDNIEKMINIIKEEIFITLDLDLSYLKTSNKYIKSTIEYINNNYEQNITLKSIAENLYINKCYLCRLIQKEFSITTSEIISIIRINKSKLFLKLTNYSVSEISELIGYKTQSHFTRQFKKIVGITPSQFKTTNNQ